MTALLDGIKRLATGSTTRVSGGEVVARMLEAEGVTKAFGIPDGTYLGLLRALGPCGIDLVTPRHETSAAHMAGAYARLTGRLGVCLASNGPGVANILPGVAVENAEGNRVLLLTSARREGTIDPDRGGTYQSFPQVEVTAPMAKWSCRVPSFERLPEVLRRALRVCHRGRPGVVHVDVPESILNTTFDVSPGWLRAPHQYRNVERLAPSQAAVDEAADLLVQGLAVIHAGSGVLHSGASAALARVAELLHAPVTTSWGARGATDERPGFAVPMIYPELCTLVRTRADVVLTLGSRLGETDAWGKPPYWRAASEQRMVQVDIDEETFGNTKPADLCVLADARLFLERLAEVLRARAGEVDVARRRAFLAEVQDERARHRVKLDAHLRDRGSPLASAHVAHACQRLFPEDAIAVFDGGNTAVWGHFFHEVRAPGAVLGTAKMGMLGAGVAQALGARVACPTREVYCVIGDGAMGFHPQEVETAVRAGLKVVFLVVCDRQWGMVKINQSFALRPLKTLVMGSLGPEETINTELGEVRWDDLARALGAHGERVADLAALEAAIARCRAQDRPAVIHVDVDPVKHLWAPGLKHFKDMHAEPGAKGPALSC